METETKIHASVEDVNHVFAAAIQRGGNAVNVFVMLYVAQEAAKHLLFKKEAGTILDMLRPALLQMTDEVVKAFQERMRLAAEQGLPSQQTAIDLSGDTATVKKPRKKRSKTAVDAEIAE